MLSGLPRAKGYRVLLKPLRYRTSPHLQAECDWGRKVITLQVPEPFLAFHEDVAYRAKRINAGRRKLTFKWFFKKVRFRTPRDVVRFLYLHEWMHYHLHDVLGKNGQAETACDRYALQNFRRRKAIVPT
jgi:hypothetical protein